MWSARVSSCVCLPCELFVASSFGLGFVGDFVVSRQISRPKKRPDARKVPASFAHVFPWIAQKNKRFLADVVSRNGGVSSFMGRLKRQFSSCIRLRLFFARRFKIQRYTFRDADLAAALSFASPVKSGRDSNLRALVGGLRLVCAPTPRRERQEHHRSPAGRPLASDDNCSPARCFSDNSRIRSNARDMAARSTSEGTITRFRWV